jgi:hypothetical protein
MKILIIGGTGLIGTKTAIILRQGGHDVAAVSPSTGVNLASFAEGGIQTASGHAHPIQCRSPFEKSQIVPVRNVTPGKVGMSLPAADSSCAKRHVSQMLGEGEGVKGRSRLAGARSAALEALALTQHNRPAVRPSGTHSATQPGSLGSIRGIRRKAR